MSNEILVIDDDKSMLRFLKTVLEEEGYNVYEFSDPLEALSFCKGFSKKFVVVITDFCMPSMNGIELISDIKKMDMDVKSIIISASEREIIDQEIKKHNDLDIIEIFQKPVTSKDILFCVNQCKVI